ncbi:MAG: metal-dependent hydrolase [Anaerolineae bacterium]|nr:MAG: metal-dependent hydrolase [Anaerolineae bacterium]
MTISLTWHGHATLSINSSGTKILVDPFFTDNPVAKTKASDVGADYILISHGHGDHTADALDIATRTGAMIISNFEICNWYNSQGYENVHAQHIGGGYLHPFGHVKLTVAFHGSGLPDGSYGGMPAGFLLTIENKKIYIAADTALFSDMNLIGQGGLDLAVLPIGDNFTMGPDDALQAVKFLDPQVVIPYHYNTWEPIAQDQHAWAERVRSECACRVVILEVDGTYSL